MFVTLALIAVLIEAAAGYPQWLFRAIGHPVTWIGALIARCERNWNRADLGFGQRRLNGIAALAAILAATLAVSLCLVFAPAALPPGAKGGVMGGAMGLAVSAVLASTLLAQRSLATHVKAVAEALDGEGLEAARAAVSRIVGRDTGALDAAAVSRAAIESLAENFSDGVVAPAFWLAAAGLPGAALYKAINTADSMIGHKSDRYLAFGWAAARLDDLVNLPASRLAALWLVLAAAATPGASLRGALRTIWRDARRHRSPNAGWPEAAMAGALGAQLAGPRVYGGVVVEDGWMGDGRAELAAADIRAALRLYGLACAIQAFVLALGAAAILAP
jgi:adenosylcobinamide-phosphate synthase